MEFLIYLYFLAFLVLAVYGLHRSTMLIRLFCKPYRQAENPQPGYRPAVCIQLPVFNEAKVIERLLQSIEQIQYPRAELSVQILDDSTDQTKQIIQDFLRRDGLEKEYSYLHRENRTGYKAGALEAGLEKTDAELIAIFDADFIPDPDFLEKTVGYFKQAELAYVQGRWTFVNKMKSLLTLAQSVLINAHFLVEHPCRAMWAHFNFNGTAGVWRKSAIIAAGGWQHDTITEDLDLSYRAAMAGYKGLYLRDITVPSELPEDIAAFKSQQYRWMKGSAQVFKKLAAKILRSDFSKLEKAEALMHLSANFCYPLMLLIAVLMVPVVYLREYYGWQIGFTFEVILFVTTFGSVFAFYFYGQKSGLTAEKPSRSEETSTDLRNLPSRIFSVFSGIVLGAGIAAHCAKACISGLLGDVGEFVRTPKSGGRAEAADSMLELASVSSEAQRKKFRRHFSCYSFKGLLRGLRNHPTEGGMFVYLLICLVILLFQLNFYTLPFVLVLFCGYAMIIQNAACEA